MAQMFLFFLLFIFTFSCVKCRPLTLPFYDTFVTYEILPFEPASAELLVATSVTEFLSSIYVKTIATYLAEAIDYGKYYFAVTIDEKGRIVMTTRNAVYDMMKHGEFGKKIYTYQGKFDVLMLNDGGVMILAREAVDDVEGSHGKDTRYLAAGIEMFQAQLRLAEPRLPWFYRVSNMEVYYFNLLSSFELALDVSDEEDVSHVTVSSDGIASVIDAEEFSAAGTGSISPNEDGIIFIRRHTKAEVIDALCISFFYSRVHSVQFKSDIQSTFYFYRCYTIIGLMSNPSQFSKFKAEYEKSAERILALISSAL